MESASSLISRRLGSLPAQGDEVAAPHTITWTPVIEKCPDCRPKLRTGLWGEVDGRVIVTVEETSDGWKWYFSPDYTPMSDDSVGYAPTRDGARDLAEIKWARKHKPKTKRAASKKADGIYKNALVSLALQSGFYLGLILLGTVALTYAVLPLQMRVVQTLQSLARLFGG